MRTNSSAAFVTAALARVAIAQNSSYGYVEPFFSSGQRLHVFSAVPLPWTWYPDGMAANRTLEAVPLATSKRLSSNTPCRVFLCIEVRAAFNKSSRTSAAAAYSSPHHTSSHAAIYGPLPLQRESNRIQWVSVKSVRSGQAKAMEASQCRCPT